NALVPVIGLTKLVVKCLLGPSPDKRNLDMVLHGAERSRDLVRQILAFSRKQDDESDLATVLDLAAVGEDALRLMRATLPSSIRLDTSIELGAPISGDAKQLQQVIVNVVTNAAQAIGEAQGRITVSLRPEGAEQRLSVADTGCGMEEVIQ